MKNILLLATTLFSIFTFAQVDPIITIPDANFKAKLLAASPSNNIASTQNIFYNNSNFTYQATSSNKIDVNNDGEIQVSEAFEIKYLDVSYSNISNLIGIESFTNLQSLKCNNNIINSLNVSSLNNLKDLVCRVNQLTNLDVSGCVNLLNLRCLSNQLSLLNLSNLTSLQVLECDGNQLSSLNLSYCTSLYGLTCNGNLLTYLNVKNGRIFQNMSYINFFGNPNLQYICADEDEMFIIQERINYCGYTNCQVNSYCSFTPGGNYNTISGQLKYDANQNSCDATDEPFSYKLLQFSDGTNTGYVATDNLGNYNAYANTGTFTLTPQIENPTYYNVSPTSATVTFPTTASPFNQNFCITPNGVHNDVEVTLIPITRARPGFNATYKIIYKNKGNQIENGAVTLTYLNQDALDIVSCNPAFNSENSDGFEKTLTWNYVNLQPLQTREITVVLNLNGPMETPALNIGETLSMTSTVTPEINDETPIDNHSSIRQVIVGSYDPNDKTCIEGTTITPAMVGEYVHYVIRFENTGTYPAQNVVVKDMIDLAKFDIATLLPIKASHNFETRIAGNKVEFIFENINLPFDDANNDGYVAFKIKTKPTLVLGDTFSNLANIYFDYNFPIITNTATTTIAALSTTDFDFGTHFTLYPNPVKEVLNFQSKDNTSIHSIEIYTTLGQVVLAVTDTLSTVDVSSLQAGNYIVKVHTDLGVSNTKFIKN